MRKKEDVVGSVLCAENKEDIVNLVTPILGFLPPQSSGVFSKLVKQGTLTDMRVFFFACLNVIGEMKAWVAHPTHSLPDGSKTEHDTYGPLTGHDGFFIALDSETSRWMQTGCLTMDRYIDGIITGYVLRYAV